MILDLREVFAGVNALTIDDALKIEDHEISGNESLDNLHFTGKVTNRADVVRLIGQVSYTMTKPCDRCADTVVRSETLDVDHIIVNELENGENDYDFDDFVVSDNMQLDLDELIRSDIILNQPVKFLCKPDCKGVCAGCGRRLNFESCICEKEMDPRLAKLSEFFDEE